MLKPPSSPVNATNWESLQTEDRRLGEHTRRPGLFPIIVMPVFFAAMGGIAAYLLAFTVIALLTRLQPSIPPISLDFILETPEWFFQLLLLWFPAGATLAGLAYGLWASQDLLRNSKTQNPR